MKRQEGESSNQEPSNNTRRLNTAPSAIDLDHHYMIIQQFEEGIFSDDIPEIQSLENGVPATLEDLFNLGIDQTLTDPTASGLLNLEGSHNFINPYESTRPRYEDKLVTGALKNNNTEGPNSASMLSFSTLPTKRNTGNDPVHIAESDKSRKELFVVQKTLSASDVNVRWRNYAVTLKSGSVKIYILPKLKEVYTYQFVTHRTLDVELYDEEENQKYSVKFKKLSTRNTYEFKGAQWITLVKKRNLEEGDTVGFYLNTIDHTTKPRFSFRVIRRKIH